MGNANEELVKQGYEAFGKGDMEVLASLMSPDVVHVFPGENQLAGEYKGQEDVFGFYGQLFELSGGTFKVDLKSATAKGDDTVVAAHRGTAERGGKKLAVDTTLTFTIEGGKITRLEDSFSTEDQAANDAFWG